MSWIESHQSLSRHRKLVKAQRLLRCDRHKLIGHLHELWWWGLDNANDDGELVGIDRGDLALAAEWKGDPDAFVVVLIEAGFLDVDASGKRLWLHDWWDYAGKLSTQRELRRESNRTAQRSRRQRLHDDDRASRKQPVSADSQHHVSADVADSQHDRQCDVSADVSSDSQRRQQPTYQPTHQPTNRESDLAHAREAQIPTKRDDAFGTFRAFYPVRAGSHWRWTEAGRAWNEFVAPGLEEACLKKLAAYRESRDVQEGIVMAPEKWLDGWQDQPDGAAKPAAPVRPKEPVWLQGKPYDPETNEPWQEAVSA